MSEPKFSIGDRVAVCTSCLSVVIPQTIITEVFFRPAGERFIEARGVFTTPSGWWYLIEGSDHRFAERTLRPIQPDEYTEPLITSREVSA